jgi:translation initiation factor IF-2
VYITPSDFSIINKIHKKQKQKGCCYIAQTLVEDGRLSKNEFIALLKEYESIVKSVSSFVIKTHPRSDISNYSVLTKYPNVTITNELPNCNSYLTHYSSLIYTVAFLSKNIIIHELNGHETPEVFKQINPKICNTVSEIIKTLKDTSIEALPSIDILKKKLKYFVEFEDIDPYENIYNNITINLNK